MFFVLFPDPPPAENLTPETLTRKFGGKNPEVI
jgi:hypothetical protein